MPDSDQLDVLVIGGGPAGSTAALMLAKYGWRVAVADRPNPRATRIVETLPPVSRSTLKSLGLWNRFVAAGHLPSSGTVSWWDTADPIEHDFIVNPFGAEWPVDRRCFDRLLASAAIEAGVTWLPIERLVEATFERVSREQRWRVHLATFGSPREVSARFVVNASGRAAALRPIQGNRRRIDRLVGLAAVFHSPALDIDRRPWIEATPSGWWYSAPSVDGQWTAVFFTDADLLRRAPRLDLAESWALAVTEGLQTARRLRQIGCPSPAPVDRFHVLAADTYVTARCIGEGWVAAGDAASAVDPLSGQGIERAIRSGLRAAHAVDAVLNHQARADTLAGRPLIDEFQRAQRAIDVEYLSQRHECYTRVRRWADRPFWRRRVQDISTAHEAASTVKPPTQEH